MSIDQRISQIYGELSPRERKTADALMEHLTDLGTYRAAELADLAGVSKATMSRFVRRLGYQDFEMLREELRARRAHGVPLAVGVAPDIDRRLDVEIDTLRRAFAELDESDVDAVARSVSGARRVVIVGQRSNFPVALHLRHQLIQVRPDVSIAPGPGQALAEDLIGLGPLDIVILVANRRRPVGLPKVLELLSDREVPVAMFADPSARIHASSVRWWIKCPLTSSAEFDSYAATMAVICLVADRVAACLSDSRVRVDQIDLAYRTLGETEAS